MIPILAAILSAVGKRARASHDRYESTGPLATATELAFLQELEKAVDPSHRVFIKVRLIDVIKPTRSKSYAARNRMIQKHLDFVVCDRSTARPLCAIELNDKSHERADRKARDEFVQSAMQSAGIPL